MQEVVAPATKDDVVAARGIPITVVDISRVAAEWYKVDGLAQLALNVEVKAQGVECVGLQRDAIGFKRFDPVQSLTKFRAVAACHDAAIVADHAVNAGTTRNPVITDTADDIIGLAVTEQCVVAAHTIDRVIARFTVDFIRGTAAVKVGKGVDICAAIGVIKQFNGARDYLEIVAICIEVEGQVIPARFSVQADQTEDVAVVADDHIRIARMACFGLVAQIIAVDCRACATKDQVASVRTVGVIAAQTVEQVGRATDDVILTKVAKDHVVAAVAFDIVVTVTAHAKVILDGWAHGQQAGARITERICVNAIRIICGAVTLDDVVAHLAKDHVILSATGDCVVAEL